MQSKALDRSVKRSVDRGKTFDALLTDLSKGFDCLDNKILIEKSSSYGLSLLALRLTHVYLPGRKQRTNINCLYSECLQNNSLGATSIDSFYSIYFWQIHFLPWIILIKKTMQTTIHRMLLQVI